ncbi:hypothetical protein N658DRAFT_390600, partial [Parathielavia hyrcaniae]
ATLASILTVTVTSGAPFIDPSPPSTPEPGALLTPVPESNTNLLLAARENRIDSGPSTFENKVSDASPLVQDCWQLFHNIAGGGTWTIWGKHRTLAMYHTCAFGAEVVGGMSMGLKIGNGDIRDLARDSIEMF